jgi:hypothetical protein
MVNNSTNINKGKGILNSDDQQFHTAKKFFALLILVELLTITA